MICKQILALSIGMASVLPVLAAEHTLFLSMKIERNGEVISSPKLIAEYGQTAAIEVGKELRLELNATNLGSAADLKMQMSTVHEGVLQVTSTPRLFAAYSSEAAIQFTDKSGVVYRVSITPTKVAKPA